MTDNHRLPAEWQYESAVILSWPHQDTDWAYMLDQVEACYVNMARAISKVAHLVIVAPDVSLVANRLKGFVDASRLTLIQVPTNDTWARDFGFISVTGDDCRYDCYDYKFNGWGLKFAACHDNLVNRNAFEKGFFEYRRARYVNRLGFVLEGGSIDIDEDGVLLTTKECLLSPNRNGDLRLPQIEDVLKSDLGAKKVIWLGYGSLEGDDTDSHIDTLARFVPGHKILYTSCDREGDSHYGDLAAMEAELKRASGIDGKPYELVPLPIPHAIYDEDGQRLPATYANFLIVNSTIFLPVYGDAKYDHMAVEAVKSAVPGYDVVTVDCRALIQQHGSLHCATMQIPKDILLDLHQ